MNLDNTNGFEDKARESCINQTYHLTLSGEAHKAQLEGLFFWDLSPQMTALSPGATHTLFPPSFLYRSRGLLLCKGQ